MNTSFSIIATKLGGDSENQYNVGFTDTALVFIDSKADWYYGA